MYHRRMDKAIFELLAARLRSQEPVRTAAKLVLIHGLTASEACKIAGVKKQFGFARNQLRFHDRRFADDGKHSAAVV